MSYQVTTQGLVDGNQLAAGLTPIQWAQAAGSSDVITAAYSPANGGLTDGLILGLRAMAANQTTTPSFAPDGLPAYVITDNAGQPLAVLDIAGAGAELLIRFNSSGPRWELLNPATNNDLIKALTGDVGASNVTTVQPWFPSQGSVQVQAIAYLVEGLLSLTQGTTTRIVSLASGGTAVIQNALWFCHYADGVPSNQVALLTGGAGALNTTTGAAAVYVKVNGIIRFTAAGTFIPQFSYSAAPGGTPTIKGNTFFRLRPMGTDAFGSRGTWA